MAHNITIKPVPHVNGDGRASKTKKDYQVIDRTRGKRVVVGVASSREKAEQIVRDYRGQVAEQHLSTHPNDRAFKEKHGISEANNV